MEAIVFPRGAEDGDDLRRWGYLAAQYDPLGRIPRLDHPALREAGPSASRLAAIYRGPLAVEFMHLPFPDRIRWIARRLESPPRPVDSTALLGRLAESECFEQVLQAHYVGTKRFSLEGMTSLIPLLDEVVRSAAAHGARQGVMGMSHRGRLNVMVHLLGKSPRDIFAQFEDSLPGSVLGSGDVKYHLGATGAFPLGKGEEFRLDLVANPSHLEAVDPVVLGYARALRERTGPASPNRLLPILLHGDAAFAGQGLSAETLNLSGLAGYEVGGTIHVVLNNLIGFTTEPEELYSSTLATDLAHRLPIPIVHVSAEEPELVQRAARIAVDYRNRFQSDVVVDLVGYRRHGHSEVDDPTTTQPLLYRRLAALPPTWKRYAQKLGKSTAEMDAIEAETKARFVRELDLARGLKEAPPLESPEPWWQEFTGGPYDPGAEVSTALPPAVVSDLGLRLSAPPEGFHLHPKVAQGLVQRREMAEGKRPVDWAMAEALAFASLLEEGIGVRLSGQDTRRGTFNQRHAALIDVQSGEEFVPLNHLRPDQPARLECLDSPLSEAGPLGFEYGYARAFPERLVVWEAQFGDFVNGAQVLIDQFLVSAEDKWGHLSGLVLLLPHGFEGQGPEHSHARPERFLQAAAHDAIQVCQPSTAAQYFHLLRRQMLRRWRKPLVVLTPKMMLRNPASASALARFSDSEFERLRVTRGGAGASRILFSSGKILHELERRWDRERREETALVSVEELYPTPEEEIATAIARFGSAREILWVQEEPRNMGALSHLLPVLERGSRGRVVRAVSRPPSGSPATGSASVHAREQAELLRRAWAEGPEGQ